mgnify:CR=1 FL=1
MKKYIPFCSLITLAPYLLAILLFAISGTGLVYLVLLASVFIFPPLIAELIGRIINAKAHKTYADVIAVYIADVLCGVPLAFYIVDDLNSDAMFFAGLGGAIALLTVVPLLALSVVVNTVFLVLRVRKNRADKNA